ncbi:hypothetical protein NC652_033449 [Populus alba x Populus x berolinensis]|nr:hypothetical protein NC652_033449 [Populus alba x Populus x berolinensis]
MICCWEFDAENMNSKQYRQTLNFLEENCPNAAKDNKKTLFSAMESVMNMMKEVELQEISAEQAKEEAARGGLDILVEVEETQTDAGTSRKRQMTCMLGEVYVEKAILATEVREVAGSDYLADYSDERG